jgi:hypothetical protein
MLHPAKAKLANEQQQNNSSNKTNDEPTYIHRGTHIIVKLKWWEV